MKRSFLLVAFAFALACFTSGCKEERSERVASSYSSVTKPTYPPTPKRAVEKIVIGVDAIPTEEDYEERAASTITEANLSGKLSELEKEMPF